MFEKSTRRKRTIDTESLLDTSGSRKKEPPKIVLIYKLDKRLKGGERYRSIRRVIIDCIELFSDVRS